MIRILVEAQKKGTNWLPFIFKKLVFNSSTNFVRSQIFRSEFFHLVITEG